MDAEDVDKPADPSDICSEWCPDKKKNKKRQRPKRDSDDVRAGLHSCDVLIWSTIIKVPMMMTYLQLQEWQIEGSPWVTDELLSSPDYHDDDGGYDDDINYDYDSGGDAMWCDGNECDDDVHDDEDWLCILSSLPLALAILIILISAETYKCDPSTFHIWRFPIIFVKPT